MNVPCYAFEDLYWWSDHVLTTCKNIKFDDYKLEIFSDASTTGWGAYCNDTKIHGWWDFSQSKQHTNLLELLAAYYALRIFASDLRSCNILLRIDNTTAVSCINRMGSIKLINSMT